LFGFLEKSFSINVSDRFYSTHDPEELTSLDEYISRMKEDQDTILYLPGDSKS
jgi:HSP90 family molecular chaperone